MLGLRSSGFIVLLGLCCFPTAGAARTVTEIIFGNILDAPSAIAVDNSGNVYVAGAATDNAFKISPDGEITEIIDWTGDGIGNTLYHPNTIAVDDSGNVYVTGGSVTTGNVFKITADGGHHPDI